LDEPKDQLPATITTAEIASDQRALNVVPALIADLGDEAAWRYVEFFTANLRNPHTRRAYARACARFFAWCEDRGLTPGAIRPRDVATYIERLQSEVSAPAVKQQLAAIRMLFNWLVTGQVVPTNPAAAVRGPKHVVKTGKTPVLEGAEWRKLLKSIPDVTLRDLRDRALIATLTYSFARIGAALPPCCCGRHRGGNRLPYPPRHRDHRLPRQRRCAKARAGNGGTREPAHDQALRPHQGAAHPGRGGEDQAVSTLARRRNPGPGEDLE
jgi:hypothetical protein